MDVVDAQRDKGKSKVTLNLGVFVPASHELIWGERAQKVEEPFCAVRTRIGALVGKNDIWWDAGDPDASEAAEAMLVEHGVPFLEGFSDLDGIVAHLEKPEVIRANGQLAKLQLISLLFLNGAVDEAQAVAQREIPKIPGAWKERALALVERMGLPIPT